RCSLSMADASGRQCHHHRSGLQFLRRRTARRCRPLPLRGTDVLGQKTENVASWFDRSKPLKARAWLDFATSAVMLVFLSGPQALAEDEPAAKAPLPPLVRGAPAETGERQIPDPGPSRNQSDPSVPSLK